MFFELLTSDSQLTYFWFTTNNTLVLVYFSYLIWIDYLQDGWAPIPKGCEKRNVSQRV